MQYKLYETGSNNIKNVVQEVLNNRGIVDWEKYLNLNESVEIPYSCLDNINEAIELFDYHFSRKNTIGILVDEDVDGFTSGSEMLGYVKKMDSKYPVKYIMHNRAKAHGLSNDVIIPEDIQLLIIPDAASNDDKQCKQLKERNIDVLILDHHEMEKENEYAVIVNNQISDKYDNKALCGAGVVYKFLQALDDYYWNEYADDFIDLVALGLIGDVMDIRSYETKYLINKGIHNIKNKALKAFIKAQDYSMNGKINIHNIQWYIVPIINAMIRVGSPEDKELVFRAFAEYDEYFEYKTRARKDKPSEVIQESIYNRAVRLCKNAKSRQDKLKEKCVSDILNKVNEEYDADNDKVIIVDATESINSGLTGVVAIKIAEMFKRPCVLLNKHIDRQYILDNETGKTKCVEKVVFGGSSRNVNNSPITSFKDVVNQCEVFDFAQGHPSAFGIQLQLDKFQEAKNKLNEMLKDTVFESSYIVDYIMDFDDLDIKLITEVDKLQDIVGQGIEDVLVALERVELARNEISLLGKNNNTISFENQNGVKFIKFNCKEDDEFFNWVSDTWGDDDTISLNVVGKPCFNEYNNVKTPQFVINDFQILSKTEIEEDFKW